MAESDSKGTQTGATPADPPDGSSADVTAAMTGATALFVRRPLLATVLNLMVIVAGLADDDDDAPEEGGGCGCK